MSCRRLKKVWKQLCFGLVILLGLFYVGVIEPNWLDVRPVSVTLPHLDPAFEGYKIVQITDIHADHWMTRDRLRRILHIANAQDPDLVALTGDYVTKAAAKFAPTLQVLKELSPKDGTVAVLGNHDHWSSAEILTNALEKGNATVLVNQVQTIQRGNATLAIAGAADAMVGEAYLPGILANMPAAGAGILLVHEPDFADETVKTGRFDLQLSGHSHGGQVRLPFINVRRITPRLGQKYPNGLYHVGSLLQYTSRGVGLAGSVRVRLNCRPEISVLTLHSPEAKAS
jgi:predicted MPP superfamily phosphohydrolase